MEGAWPPPQAPESGTEGHRSTYQSVPGWWQRGRAGPGARGAARALAFLVEGLGHVWILLLKVSFCPLLLSCLHSAPKAMGTFIAPRGQSGTKHHGNVAPVTLWRQYHSPGSGTGTPQDGAATTSGTTVAKDRHVSVPRTGDHPQGRWVDGGRQVGEWVHRWKNRW